MAPELDMTFINELYEDIERNPPGLMGRKILIQQFLTAEWHDSALGAAQELLQLDPNDTEAQSWVRTLQNASSSAERRVPFGNAAQAPTPPVSKEPKIGEDQQLKFATVAATDKGSSVRNVLGSVLSIGKKRKHPMSSRSDMNVPDLVALSDGRESSVVKVRPPGNVKAVARKMGQKPDEAVNIAATDLEHMARWLSSSTPSSPLDSDAIREALAKRVKKLDTYLLEALKPHASTALMHVEHEVLRRMYICRETMYGDPVADIPRSKFLVTEDGYPWDMEELAGAISSNGGVMRNPLSKQLFTPNDVRNIIEHPLGKGLAAMQIEQANLKQGVRPQTIEQLDQLAAVLLADQSSDQMESRHVVDEFATYMATLPADEQTALDELRVHARDSHTGQAFDTSIGEAVRDALGNRICFHKAGDLIQQAVLFLRR